MDQLPNELICLICDNIKYIKDKIRYSMICKRHNNITKKLILNEITVFDRLPNKLILLIYDNIKYIDDKLRYSMTCKRHNNITKKLISKEITFYYWCYVESDSDPGLSEIEYVRDYIFYYLNKN